jgi:hypothetical protein
MDTELTAGDRLTEGTQNSKSTRARLPGSRDRKDADRIAVWIVPIHSALLEPLQVRHLGYKRTPGIDAADQHQ